MTPETAGCRSITAPGGRLRALPSAATAVRGCGAGCAGIGAGVLVGWSTSTEVLKRVLSGLPAMKPAGAVCAILIGLALMLLPGRRAARIVSAAASGAVGLIAGLNLLEFLTGHSVGIDRLLFARSLDPEPHPGRMAPAISLSCTLLALALLAAGRRCWAATQVIGLVVLTGSSVPIGSFLFEARSRTSSGTSSAEFLSFMPIHAAIAVLLASVGVLAGVPGGVLAVIRHGRGPGVKLLRRVLPVVLLALPVLGELAWSGTRLHWYAEAFAVALMVISSITVLLATLWRASMAVDRADSAHRHTEQLLHAHQARVAAELQQALLPQSLPQIAHITSAARYTTASGDTAGGDWYDVIALHSGRIALVVGDVEGHDVTAAAVMGQVRNALTVYAEEGHPPGDILTRLNSYVCRRFPLLVTCCYLELDPCARTVVAVTAGHPAPLLITPTGVAQHLPVRIEPPLGVEPAHTYQECANPLPDEVHLVLYTDGLLDGRSSTCTIDLALANCGHLDLGTADRLADTLLTDPDSTPPTPLTFQDDAALLVVHLHPHTDPTVTIDLTHPAVGRPDSRSAPPRPPARTDGWMESPGAQSLPADSHVQPSLSTHRQ